MNIVNTLTIRHIKSHKKRSILTIMAIIVSVAMVTAVFTSALSFVKYFQNVASAIDGSWHSYIHTNDYLNVKDTLNNDDIEKYGIDLYYGMSNLNNQDNDVYELTINACDENYLDLRNITVSEGRKPTKANEILILKDLIDKNKLNWKLGDTVNIPVEFPNGKVINQEFKIVGITNSHVAETDSVEGFIFATDDIIKEIGETSVYIKYSKLNKSVYDKTEKIAKSINKGNDDLVYGYNTELLSFSGVTTDDETLKVLVGFCAIILLIIAIVSIFIIYDSFAVSYQDRAKYLGMLASVGATKKQKRASIYYEGLILGLISIPLGIIAGIGGIWITFKAISGVWIDTLGIEYNKTLTVSINWIVILGTILASAITIFLSSYIPAKKASKTTAIDAIRQTNTVKVKKAKKLKASKLSTKLLGYEGALAVKNFKRNSRRSRTIVFALFMSVVVFLSVANFSLMFSDVMNQTYSQNADLKVSVLYQDAQNLEKALNNTNGIKNHFSVEYEYASFDKNLINEKLKDKCSESQMLLVFVDNNTLDTYLKQLGEDTSKYHNIKNPTAILHNTSVIVDKNKKARIEPLVNLTGKRIDTKIQIMLDDKSDEITFSPTIGIQTTEDYNNDLFYYQKINYPMAMMSIDYVGEYLGKTKDFQSQYIAEITCDNADEIHTQLDESILEDYNIKEYNIYNPSSDMNAINNILTIVKVFVFGFIALITLISIMNIINTISNSMNERRREFAMIRSVGMTPKSFKKMIYYESFRYGFISLLWSIPISAIIHYAMYYVLSKSYDYGFQLHLPIYFISIFAVFIVIGVALLYSIGKIKNDNIIETLKQDIN